MFYDFIISTRIKSNSSAVFIRSDKITISIDGNRIKKITCFEVKQENQSAQCYNFIRLLYYSRKHSVEAVVY